MATAIKAILLIETDGTLAGGAGNDDLTVNRPFTVYDVHGVIVTQGATTTTVQKGAAAISSALDDNAAVGTLRRTTSISLASNAQFASGDIFRVAYSGAGREAVYTAIIPRSLA